MEVITSRENKIIKLAANLIANKKTRDENDMFVIEGIKTINEIPDDYDIKSVIVSESFYKSIDINYQINNKKRLESILCVASNQLFKSISSMTTPEGILAIVCKKKYDLDGILDNENVKKIILLDDIRDPGNLGTIIRSADAMGMDAVITSLESVDMYSPKVTRSTMGSMFHLPIIDKVNLADTIKTLKKCGFAVCATSLKAENDMHEVVKNADKIAVIIGNEAHGVSEDIINMSDETFIIKMKGNAESLNASIAASIIMYELSKV